MGLGPGAGDIAALGLAGALRQGEGQVLGRAEDPLLAPEVEDLSLAVEDGGEGAGGAGQPTCFGGTQRLATDELPDPELALERLQADGDDDRGGATAVPGKVGGVDALDEAAERRP